MFTLKLTDAHILGMIMAYLLGFFIMPYVIWFAKKNNLIDKPNERKIHHGPIARLGGIAIWSSSMLSLQMVFLPSARPGSGA